MNPETDQMILRGVDIALETQVAEPIVLREAGEGMAVRCIGFDRGMVAFLTGSNSHAKPTETRQSVGQVVDQSLRLIEAFTTCRPQLFRIAYRILGCASDAEDMMQEVWLRWQRQAVENIQSPKAWLGAATKRLCIDQLRSARRQREDSYGLLLPEFLMEESEAKPDRFGDEENLLPAAFGLMMKVLGPVERVVFLLHEVFDYAYADIAVIVGKDIANCRQIARRAKVHLYYGVRSLPAPDEQARDLVRRFMAAAATGEVRALLTLLNKDVNFGFSENVRVEETVG